LLVALSAVGACHAERIRCGAVGLAQAEVTFLLGDGTERRAPLSPATVAAPLEMAAPVLSVLQRPTELPGPVVVGHVGTPRGFRIVARGHPGVGPARMVGSPPRPAALAVAPWLSGPHRRPGLGRGAVPGDRTPCLHPGLPPLGRRRRFSRPKRPRPPLRPGGSPARPVGVPSLRHWSPLARWVAREVRLAFAEVSPGCRPNVWVS
jgi:hypothetical protein